MSRHSCHSYGPSGGGYGGLGVVVYAAAGQSYGGVTSGPFYEPVVATGPAGQVYAADAGLRPPTRPRWLWGVHPAATATRTTTVLTATALTDTTPGSAPVGRPSW